MFAPFGNQTAKTSATWYPEPRGRGTFNILSSCLTTMILCVWTAVHLNIPGHNEGTRQKVIRKLRWLLLALLAPEVVAWNAWEQRRVAWGHMSAFRKAFEQEQVTPPGCFRRARFYFLSPKGSCPDSEKGSSSSSHSKITLVHGFYAAMGGYVIPSHSLDKQQPITSLGTLTLTQEGIQWLSKYAPEVFPDVTEAEILDKSKASTLVKTLTCLQAFWFCLQCIVRLTMNASISLLELNVFGHCICTFIIYAIWWNKPMDITEPTMLGVKGKPKSEGLVAWLCSNASRTVPKLPHPLAECAETGYKYTDWAGVSVSDDNHWQQRCEYDFQTRFSTSSPPVRGRDDAFWRGHALDADYNEKQVDECEGLHIERLKQLFNLDASLPQIKVSMYEAASSSKVRLAVGSEQIGLTYYLSRAKLEKLNLKNGESEQLENLRLISGKPKETSEDCYRLERSFLVGLDLERQHSRPSEIHPWVMRFPKLFVDRSCNWRHKLDREVTILAHLRLPDPDKPVSYVGELWSEWFISRIPEGVAVSAAAFIYGGLHLLAWSAPFHAPISGLLWKISCITTASLGTFPLLMQLPLVFYNKLLRGHRTNLLVFCQIILLISALFGEYLFIPFYIFARVYLVVESFFSLAYLPESVLVTPNFSLYFPHIG